MKVKYLAYLDLGYFAIGLLFGSWFMRAAAVASLINFFLFFWAGLPAPGAGAAEVQGGTGIIFAGR